MDFIKRRPRYPIGDDPRGREIKFQETDMGEAYGDKPVFRAFRGRPPIEGQRFGAPEKRGKIISRVKDLRPELPNRSIDAAANEAAQALQDASLLATDHQIKYPIVTLSSPAPGASFSPGDTITVLAPASALLNLYSATLEIDGVGVDRRIIDRRDQMTTLAYTFGFTYQIPPTQSLGSMSITVRVFNAETSFRGIIADDAPDEDARLTGLPTLDGRPGSSTSATGYQKLFDETGIMKSPEGVVSISVNIV